jgi:hypothetical protein
MWSGDEGPFEGKHYQLAETNNSPQPVSTPHPPIMIGGGGEKKTLRLVAKYADACNLFGVPVADVAQKLEVLRRHCEAEGTDYDRISKTMLYLGPKLMEGDHDGFLAEMDEYAAVGIETVMVMPLGPEPLAFTEGVVERVVPRLVG